jgi:sugar lactone lactonase YvrE
MSFVCGAEHPEDLARIPGTRWLVASGFANGSGIKLVDMNARTLRRWYTGETAQNERDSALYPDCPAPPDAALMNAQGMSLRSLDDHTHLLYVSNHGGREAIEVFRIERAGDEPALKWTGCVPMPAGMAANSVATFRDGTILVTVLNRPGTQIADYVQGRVTGLVYEWRPGTHELVHVRGADLPGNNGLEVSKDGKEFYVVAFGWHAVVAFAHSNPTRILRKAVAPGFMPDNIKWDGDQLIAAGMQYDEPACGGLRKIVDGVADPMLCHRGWTVAHLDPKSMAWSLVAYGEPNPSFNGTSTGLIAGAELWLGSFQADRIAIRKLPRGP